MGKKRKIKSASGDLVTASSLPLDVQIAQERVVKAKTPRIAHDNDLDKNEFIDEKTSSKILSLARKQREEEEFETNNEPQQKRAKNLKKRVPSSSSDTEEDEFALNEMRNELDEIINEQTSGKRTLYDIIQEKIARQQQHDSQSVTSEAHVQLRDLQPEVVKMYKEVGELLAKYRSGKIPKAFKIIPNMVNWEQILDLTHPDNWSAAAMLHATRLFSSNLNKLMCQRFYNLVLLPRIRDDIDEFKKLNFHLYQSLYKALYRPDVFFKGILLPLCQSGSCTLREAVIIGSVLRKCSIPMAHSAAAMLRIAEMEYTGSSSMFLRILIEKKYTLPYRVLDGLVEHFYKMRSETRALPVLWHQSLLAFVQHYKSDLSLDQRRKLFDLIKAQNHYQISPEIRRELEHAEDTTQTNNDAKVCSARNDGMEF
uniref:Bystin n=1 Tax=Acrobeloides nanus TaxID=290746 RepID=A0A914CNJ3_9BILA